VDETRSEPPKIKVVDRRKFTAEGDLMEDSVPIEEAAAPESSPEEHPVEPKSSNPEPIPDPPPPRSGSESSQLFLELVTMLAGQAELLLVGAEDLPARPAEAQRMIDYLGVLEEKTAGHLSDDETQVLSSVLYQLRTFYLQRK